MSLTLAVILASVAVYSWKLLGNLVPERFLASTWAQRTSGLLTVALLAALAGTQAFTAAGQIVLDFKLLGVAVAVGLLLLRAPFWLVVVAAAATTALLRLWF